MDEIQVKISVAGYEPPGIDYDISVEARDVRDPRSISDPSHYTQDEARKAVDKLVDNAARRLRQIYGIPTKPLLGFERIELAASKERVASIAADAGCEPTWLIMQVLTALGVEVEENA